MAETEKYAHVTYFFNGGVEEPYPLEERSLVPSPRDVPTYDHKPEMSAPEAAGEFVAHWRAADRRRAAVSVRHHQFRQRRTWSATPASIAAATRAVETVDRCLGDVVAAVHEHGGALIVTADHGNADEMLEPDGSPATAHSTNPVPLIVTVPGLELREGVLADVIPTALELLGIEQDPAMTGHSLVRSAAAG